jgi:hypothetical protein
VLRVSLSPNPPTVPCRRCEFSQKFIGIYKMFKAPLNLMVLLICQLKIRLVGVYIWSSLFEHAKDVKIRFLGIEGYGAEEWFVGEFIK